MINFKNILYFFNIIATIILYIGGINTYITISEKYDGTNFIIGCYLILNGFFLSFILFKKKKIDTILNINIQNKTNYLIFIVQFLCSLFMLTLNTLITILGSIVLFISILNISYAFFVDEDTIDITEPIIENEIENENEMRANENKII